MDEYPAELLADASPLLGLMGPSDVAQRMQSGLAAAASSKLRFLTMDLGTALRPRKEVKSPTHGIIKANWLHKHVSQLPACLLLLVPWQDARESSPSELANQESRLANVMHNVLPYCRSRSVRCIVALVVRDLSGGEAREERAAAVTRAHSEPVTIVSLPSSTDSSSAWDAAVQRLARHVGDMCVWHHREESRRLRKWRDSHRIEPALAIRIDFKIGFHSERAGDVSGAVHAFASGYFFLTELQRFDVHAVEHKAVADVFNFKLCRLYMAQGQVVSAVAQFRHHMHAFSSYVGAAAFAFEHWAWVSRQYVVFAQLCMQAASALDPRDRYQSPGYYYQRAATAAIERQRAARRLCGDFAATPGLLPRNPVAIDLTRQVYVGGAVNDDASHGGDEHPLAGVGRTDPQQEAVEAARRHSAEAGVDHNAQVIDLLTRAYEYYKQDRANNSRMILFLAVQMAQQYLEAGQFDMARKFFDRVSKTYRKEAWPGIIGHILVSAAECARRLGRPRDFVECALELITASAGQALPLRQAVQTELLDVLSASSSLPHALASPVQFDMSASHPLLRVHLSWHTDASDAPASRASVQQAHHHASATPTCVLGSAATLRVALTLDAAAPLRWSRLQVRFRASDVTITAHDPTATGEDTAAATEAAASDSITLVPELPADSSDASRATNLMLAPRQRRVFDFPVTLPRPQTYELAALMMQLGSSPRAIVLAWSGAEIGAASAPAAAVGSGRLSASASAASMPSSSAAAAASSSVSAAGGAVALRVLPLCDPLVLDVQLAPPAMVDESFRIPLQLSSDADTIDSAVISVLAREDGTPASALPASFVHISLVSEDADAGDQDQQPGGSSIAVSGSGGVEDAQQSPQPQRGPTFSLAAMQAHSTRRVALVLRCTRAASLKLMLRLGYSCSGDASSVPRAPIERTLHLPVQQTFALTYRYFAGAARTRAVSSVPRGHDVMLRVGVEALAPVPVLVHSVRLQLHGVPENEQPHDYRPGGTERPHRLEHSDVLTAAFLLRRAGIHTVTGTDVVLGVCHVTWSRVCGDGEAAAQTTTSSFDMSPTPLRDDPLHIAVDAPRTCTLGKAVSVRMQLSNTSGTPETAVVHVTASSDFLMSGLSATSVLLPPFTARSLTYRMVPVSAGYTTYPVLKVHRRDVQEDVSDVVIAAYVLPSSCALSAR